MRDAAQAAFDAAQHDGHVLERLAAALAVDDGGAVRPLAAYIARGVGVVAADFAIRRVAVDHGIHVAAVTPQNRLGLPSALNASALCQSGWAMMPTRKPCASSVRPITAMPKLGWST
jgi:hypothetical protein